MKAKLQSLVLGPIMTNVYFLENPETKEMILIDPADAAERIESKVREMDGTPVAILLTHAHFDHILALDAVRKTYQVPVYVEEKDEPVLENPEWNLSGWQGLSISTKADHLLRDGDILQLAGMEIHVLHTPGHTQGSCCYYLPDQKMVFTGDTLFCESYGRTDFPTSSAADIQNSVRRLLRELPPDTDVFPGHESFSRIEEERKYNPLAE
jgi:hydroxyacylglutathione hydrolase